MLIALSWYILSLLVAWQVTSWFSGGKSNSRSEQTLSGHHQHDSFGINPGVESGSGAGSVQSSVSVFPSGMGPHGRLQPTGQYGKSRCAYGKWVTAHGVRAVLGGGVPSGMGPQVRLQLTAQYGKSRCTHTNR